MQQFEIILKNEKVRGYRLLALLMVLLNTVIFIFLLPYDFKRYEAAGALVLIVIYILIRIYISKKNNQPFYFDELIFFILAGCWIAVQSYFAVLACIALGMLYRLSLQELRFLFTSNIVEKLNFPKTRFYWHSFANVMIKDRILTLDLVNNKLIQMEIENTVDEARFNDFAQTQIRLQRR